MTQINQYPLEATNLGDQDLFDIDYFDSSGGTFETKRIKWGTIKVQLTADGFAQNLGNSNLTQTAGTRFFNMDSGSLIWQNAENFEIQPDGSGGVGHWINYQGAPETGGRTVANEQIPAGSIKRVFTTGSRAYRALNNGTFWFGDSSTIGQFSGFQPPNAFHATFISQNKKVLFTDYAITAVSDPSDSIAWFRSTTKGVLFPNLTTIARNAIPTPRLGLVIYNTDTNRMQVYDGTPPSGWSNMN